MKSTGSAQHQCTPQRCHRGFGPRTVSSECPAWTAFLKRTKTAPEQHHRPDQAGTAVAAESRGLPRLVLLHRRRGGGGVHPQTGAVGEGSHQPQNLHRRICNRRLISGREAIRSRSYRRGRRSERRLETTRVIFPSMRGGPGSVPGIFSPPVYDRFPHRGAPAASPTRGLSQLTTELLHPSPTLPPLEHVGLWQPPLVGGFQWASSPHNARSIGIT